MAAFERQLTLGPMSHSSVCFLFLPGLERRMCETEDPRLRPGAAEPHPERVVSAARQDVPRPRLAGRTPTRRTRCWSRLDPRERRCSYTGS